MEREFTIVGVKISEIDLPITTAFTISQGEVVEAKNLIVDLELANGSIGFGEIAPFPELTGETRADCLSAAREVSELVTGLNVTNYRGISGALRQEIPQYPSVRCGFETAMVDALSRGAGLPLWALWGGADVRKCETDITIPIRELNESLQIVSKWHDQGFRRFKMKVGIDVDRDVSRLNALADNFPNLSLIIDANQGYAPSDAISLVRSMEKIELAIEVFEQPVDRDDLDGMRRVRESSRYPIAADESVFSLKDAMRVIELGAADVVNLKITKSGLIETIDIASLCKTHGIGLMIGGMIETRVAMGCSFSLVLGLGGIDILDLDTPLLMEEDPFNSGGYQYDGPFLIPWHEPGLGLKWKNGRSSLKDQSNKKP